MLQRQLSRVQINARRRCAAVKRVSKYGEPHRGGVHPDLMRAPSQRFRFNHVPAISTPAFPEPCFRRLPASMDRPAHIPFPGANERAPDRELALADRAIRQQEVFLANAARGELPGERAIGQWRLRKHDYAGGLLVEPVNDCQLRPPGLAMSQPVVKPLAGVRAGGVRVQAGRLVHHQQMVILEDQAREHWRGWLKGLKRLKALKRPGLERAYA
jgi:hypothetical protein